MKLREMRLIWEVHRTGSVTAAADVLAMTQPAASLMLRQLDERLGFHVFDRDRRRLSVSAKGRGLLPDLAAALAALDGLSRTAQSLRTEAPRRLLIGTVASAAGTVLPRALGRMRPALRDTTVTVRTAMSLEIERMVAEGSVDFGLVVRGGEEVAANGVRVATLQLHCVAPAGSALARRRLVPTALLARRSYVSLSRQFTIGAMVARMLEDGGHRYAPAVEVMHYSSACAFVEQGWGVAVLDTLGALHARRLGLGAPPIADSPALGLDLLCSPHSSAMVHAAALSRHLGAAFEAAQRG
ncbi:LysR family transcriptional regulator [Pseudacidovorax intermedius]|uniref:LysR family transcriptional regulator n=1 Tax=Pseudacidovorax intermedius TaxID=433924 RepID=UPI00034D5AD7|nr:LysR family transcriptional regulator [Pseudacidovorax intermedius]